MERGNPPTSSIPESGRPEGTRPRHRSSAAAQMRAASIGVVGGAAAGGSTALQVEDPQAAEVQNQRAIEVLARVKEKLTGRDFRDREPLKVDVQVDKLIREATNLENLCQHFIGWCSFW
jgi:phosphatidylinositol kinase/protein kinase (PI-3  family)